MAWHYYMVWHAAWFTVDTPGVWRRTLVALMHGEVIVDEPEIRPQGRQSLNTSDNISWIYK
jgi:hypothetical protein